MSTVKVDTAIPATRLLSSKLPGFDPTPIYPLHPDLAKARKLMAGRHVHAVFATFDPSFDSHTAAFTRAVRDELGAIGISVTILPLVNADFGSGGLERKLARADFAWGGGTSDTGDAVVYLKFLPYLPASARATLRRIAHLPSPGRDEQAVALARTLEKRALYAVYEDGAIPEIVSARLGCVVHQPEYAGVDLAALCLRSGR